MTVETEERDGQGITKYVIITGGSKLSILVKSLPAKLVSGRPPD
jgi:hypothetical protein